MNRQTLIWLFVISIFCGTLMSCLKNTDEGIPDDVLEVLHQSGLKKPSLMMVILEYQEPKDSLKLQAAYQLIKYLKTNYSVDYSLVDSNDIKVFLNINRFSDYNSVLEEKRRLESIFGKLHYKADTIILDLDLINSGQLINHINSTINRWDRNNTDEYSKMEFMNYILPYRVANEWPEELPSDFEKTLEELRNSYSDKRALADTINRLINSQFIIDDRLNIHPYARNLDDVFEKMTGSSLEINIIKVNALRESGIAAALDYSPFFIDSISGYYTTTGFFPDGSFVNYGKTNFDSVLFHNPKVAKVFRRVFSCPDSCLFTMKEVSEFTPPFMGNYCYIDVTNDYINTRDTTILFPENHKYVYLAINNDGELKAIDWSVNIDGKASFKNLGLGIDYTPVVVKNKSLVKTGRSFTLK